MEQVVRIQKLLPDGTAQVLRIRESACSGDCHKCGGCGSEQQKLLLNARNPIGAQPGDMVVIEADTAPVLISAMLLYLLPVVLFIGGYLAGELWWHSGIGLSLAGLLVGFVLVKLYDRHMTTKRTVFTITGYAKG